MMQTFWLKENLSNFKPSRKPKHFDQTVLNEPKTEKNSLYNNCTITDSNFVLFLRVKMLDNFQLFFHAEGHEMAFRP